MCFETDYTSFLDAPSLVLKNVTVAIVTRALAQEPKYAYQLLDNDFCLDWILRQVNAYYCLVAEETDWEKIDRVDLKL